jgi:pyruvate ferredoxin oxidoreductase beta subunit
VHGLVPCPLGWGADPRDTIRLARLATETGLFPVFEAEHGEVVAVSKIRRRAPVEDYLVLQGRFKHLFDESGQPSRPDLIGRLQDMADRSIACFGLLDEGPGS